MAEECHQIARVFAPMEVLLGFLLLLVGQIMDDAATVELFGVDLVLLSGLSWHVFFILT